MSVCETCGVVYVAKSGRQKFCSTSCQQNWWNKARWRGSHERTCIRCGKEFQAERSSRRYCSLECKEDQRGRRERLRTGVCGICGISFETTDHRRKRCYDCDKYRSKGVQRVPPELRARILRGQQGCCWLCKGTLSFTDAKVHHLDGSGPDPLPNHSVENLVAVHSTCHRLFHQVSLLRKEGTWVVSGGIFNMIKMSEVPTIGEGVI